MSHKRNAQDEVFTHASSPVVNTVMVTNYTLQGEVQTTPPELSLLRRVSTWGWLRLSSCACGCSPLWDLWLMTALLKGGAGGGGTTWQTMCSSKAFTTISSWKQGLLNYHTLINSPQEKAQPCAAGKTEGAQGEWYCCSQLLLSVYNENGRTSPALKAQNLINNTCLSTFYRFLSSSGNRSSPSQVCSVQILILLNLRKPLTLVQPLKLRSRWEQTSHM